MNFGLKHAFTSVLIPPQFYTSLGVFIAAGLHLIPSRTQKLSPHTAKIVPGKPGAKIAQCPLYSPELRRSSLHRDWRRFFLPFHTSVFLY